MLSLDTAQGGHGRHLDCPDHVAPKGMHFLTHEETTVQTMADGSAVHTLLSSAQPCSLWGQAGEKGVRPGTNGMPYVTASGTGVMSTVVGTDVASKTQLPRGWE